MAFIARWVVVVLFNMTEAIRRLHLSPDSLFLILVSFFPSGGSPYSPLLAIMAALVLILGVSMHLLGFGFLGTDYIAQSHYFDLEYINQTRGNIGDHGSGAFFDDPSTALWGEDLISTLKPCVAAPGTSCPRRRRSATLNC